MGGEHWLPGPARPPVWCSMRLRGSGESSNLEFPGVQAECNARGPWSKVARLRLRFMTQSESHSFNGS